MERLTKYICDHAHGAEGVRVDNLTGDYCRGEFEATAIVDRLAAIEDILGDEYDLERLRELAQADREGRCIVLPRKLFVGQKIWVIEPESRTGQEKQAWVNTVKGFGHGEIFYQHGGCPVYSETFDNIGKTIFLNCEDAEAALKGEQNA